MRFLLPGLCVVLTALTGCTPQVHVRELRRATLPLQGQLELSNTNGQIEVVGEDRRDVALEATLEAQAPDRGEAESILRQVNIVTQGAIHAEGPTSFGSFHGGSWSVSYRLRVPEQLNTELKTINGSIDLSNIAGSITASTTNGAISLQRVSGDVHATSVNGAIAVRLDGSSWQGNGLSAQTTNGGISVKAPEGYSAHLVAATENGVIAVSLPTHVQGAIQHNLDTNLGQGGATLHLETVNGGVSVSGSGSGTKGEE